MHIMDGQRLTKPQTTRRRHSDAFKQALVERSLVREASVAAIAQDAGVNANLLFNWRRLHLQSLASTASKGCRRPVLLPVTIVEPTPACSPSPPPPPSPTARAAVGIIEINVRGMVVRVRGPVDEASLRTVLRALASAA